jgi:endoglucanase
MKSPNHNPPRPHHRGLITALALSCLALCATTPAAKALSMLHASGRNIVDASGNVVHLKGVNLGGLFVMEKWMTPLDSGSVPDTYAAIQKLDQRFGVATEQSLIKGFQDNWITTTDLDNIKALGLNCVRVPVWWGQFFTLSSYGDSPGWRSDAFYKLDWIVNNCASRGIYVIIDMHGVVGGQSTSDSCGQASTNQYWTNGSYQGRTAYMWWQIANRYNGNATVAGYDLINEPTGAPTTNDVWSRYNDLYNTIRGVDSGHMIIMEGAFGSWNWSMLPNPSQYGWTNICYSMHEYQYGGSASQVESGANNQVNDFNNHSSYNVPGYIGEFNEFGYGASVWQYGINAFNNGNLSWTMWTYKATHGLNTDSWGLYDPKFWPTTPNLSSDSSATIASDWAQWSTSNAFVFNATDGITASSGGGNHVVAIKANANNMYVCADNAGSSALIANRSTVGTWETFDEIDEGNGIIALRAHANNQYVTADNAGSSPLIANRTSVGTWEEFQVVTVSGGVALKALANNQYVCADNAGASALIANRTSVGTWETFQIINQ